MMFTVLTVYYVRAGGLNPLQLVLVGTVMEIAEFLFEVPTGVVADTYGRRLSVIIGTFITGAAFVFVGLAPSFPTIALGLAVWGVGATFLSGAREAWIVDEVGEEHARYVFLRTAQLRRLAALVGTLASAGLASVWLNLPIVLGGALTVGLGVYLVLAMPETGFRPEPRRAGGNWAGLATTLRDGVQLTRSRPLLLWFLALGIVFGAYAEAFDRLGDAHFLLSFNLPGLGGLDPVAWFGVIGAGSQLVGFAAAGLAARRLRLDGARSEVRALVALQALWIACVVAFGLAPTFALALAAYWAVGAIATIHGPIYEAWLNRNIDSRVRATALSVVNQADALGQLTGGPAIGAVGTVFSLRAAMVASGLVLSPAFLLYARALRHGGTAPATSEPQPGRAEP